MTIMTSARFLVSVALLGGIVVACSDSQPEQPEQSFAERFQEMLITAEPGSVIEVPAGVHRFERSLSLDVPDITLRGAGMDSSILSFAGQIQGAEGLLVTADNFTIEDLAIEDTTGDALKINDSSNVVIRNVRTEWTNGPDSDNGAYGIYPVQSRNILIEGAVAIGAADAGIYVGQSSQIIVRNSRAEYNVAGIEIENSTYADVYNNIATNNTGGILVFDLPNLEVQGGQATRVFDNDIHNNNTENFAPAGAIVGNVPAGTGLLILANDDIEVFGNRFADNQNVNIMVYSFLLGGRTVDDPAYDPYPERIHIHDNQFSGGGERPGHALLARWHSVTGEIAPDIVWGGLVRPGSSTENLLCLGETERSSFLNLNGGANPAQTSRDSSAHACSLPRLPAISLALP